MLMFYKDGMKPLRVAKVIKKLQLLQLLLNIDVFLDKICLKYVRNEDYLPQIQ